MILCLTVCYTLLIALSDGTQRNENNAPVVPAGTTSWSSLSIHVMPKVEGHPDANYRMVAQPVLAVDGKSVLYDLSARFDQGPVSGLDKSITIYKQTRVTLSWSTRLTGKTLFCV